MNAWKVLSRFVKYGHRILKTRLNENKAWMIRIRGKHRHKYLMKINKIKWIKQRIRTNFDIKK